MENKRRNNYTNIYFSALNCTQPPVQLTGLQKKLKSTYKSLELTTATRLPTVIHHTPNFYESMASYKAVVPNLF